MHCSNYETSFDIALSILLYRCIVLGIFMFVVPSSGSLSSVYVYSSLNYLSEINNLSEWILSFQNLNNNVK